MPLTAWKQRNMNRDWNRKSVFYFFTELNKKSKDIKIQGYDIFEDFNGNHANKEKLLKKFKEYTNVCIEYGDFYKLHKTLNTTFDIIHIDTANNGDVYEYAIDKYLSKLTVNGVLILEGGSKERDQIDWMKKYNKPQIQPVLCKYKNDYNILTIGTVPSISLIQRNWNIFLFNV